jgi:hypothetical protein
VGIAAAAILYLPPIRAILGRATEIFSSAWERILSMVLRRPAGATRR